MEKVKRLVVKRGFERKEVKGREGEVGEGGTQREM